MSESHSSRCASSVDNGDGSKACKPDTTGTLFWFLEIDTTMSRPASGLVTSFWKEIKSLILENKKIVAFLALLTCPQLAGWLTSRTKEAGEEALQGIVGDEVAKPKPTTKPAPKPTPKEGKFANSRYVPESQPKATPNSEPEASPTPYVKKNNWGGK